MDAPLQRGGGRRDEQCGGCLYEFRNAIDRDLQGENLFLLVFDAHPSNCLVGEIPIADDGELLDGHAQRHP